MPHERRVTRSAREAAAGRGGPGVPVRTRDPPVGRDKAHPSGWPKFAPFRFNNLPVNANLKFRVSESGPRRARLLIPGLRFSTRTEAAPFPINGIRLAEQHHHFRDASSNTCSYAAFLTRPSPPSRCAFPLSGSELCFFDEPETRNLKLCRHVENPTIAE